MNIGYIEILLVAIIWVFPAALLFFFLYWTIRLAIRHEKRRLPTPREIADQERAAQYRPGRRRPE